MYHSVSVPHTKLTLISDSCRMIINFLFSDFCDAGVPCLYSVEKQQKFCANDSGHFCKCKIYFFVEEEAVLF